MRADGRQCLDNLIEELHQLILQNRVNKPLKLFQEQHNKSLEPRTNYKPIIITSLIAFFALAITYVGSHSLLEHQAQQVLSKTTQYTHMEH